jgi:uncharacterized membrane protein YuzA (DUF378 family)
MLDAKNQDLMCKVALVIAAIGAINWYLSTMDYNLVNKFLGDNKQTKITTTSDLEKFAYLLVGLSGVVLLWCGFFSNKAQGLRQQGKMIF